MLHINENRGSSFGYCSHQLFWLKFFPEPIPPKAINIMRDRFTGVVEIPDGKPLTGTMMHEIIGPMFGKENIIAIERKIDATVILDPKMKTYVQITDLDTNSFRNPDAIDFSMHLDIEIKLPDGKTAVVDIKSTQSDTFEQIIGIQNMKAGSYASQKLEENQHQVNAYAHFANRDETYILWYEISPSRYIQTIRWKLEKFEKDPVMFARDLEKFADIWYCFQESKRKNTYILPKPAGVPMCNYCKFHKNRCMGKETLELKKLGR